MKASDEASCFSFLPNTLFSFILCPLPLSFPHSLSFFFPSFQPSFTTGWCVFFSTFPIIVHQFAAPCLYVPCPVSVRAHTHSSYDHLAVRAASQHFLGCCCSSGPGLLTLLSPMPREPARLIKGKQTVRFPPTLCKTLLIKECKSNFMIH